MLILYNKYFIYLNKMLKLITKMLKLVYVKQNLLCVCSNIVIDILEARCRSPKGKCICQVFLVMQVSVSSNLAGNCLFKFIKRNNQTMCEICSKLMKKSVRRQSVDFVLEFLLLTFNRFQTLFCVFQYFTLNK